MAKRVMKSWGTHRAKEPPNGKIRQSQVVGTFGAGSLLDLVDDAVLVGGLNFWKWNDQRVIVDRRLREAVQHVLGERKLRYDKAFLKPPAGDEQGPARGQGIQVLEFPHWFVCQNPKCRRLLRSSSLEMESKHYIHQCDGPERRRERCVPIRFVASCPRGHLADVNWTSWAHEGPSCDAPQLQLDEGATGDFAEVKVLCLSCQAKRPLIDLTVKEKAGKCNGERPWLGADASERCTESRKLLVRSASNGYFPQVMSALSLPELETDVRSAVQSVWGTLQVATAQSLSVFRTIPEVAAAIGAFTDEAVLAAIAQLKTGLSPPREEIRTAEYRTFLAAKAEKAGELPQNETERFYFARTATPRGGLPTGFSRLVLLKRLKEVRVQIGFTRFEAATPNLQGEYDLGVESAPLGLDTDWLPASEVQGEGFFLQLDEALLKRWEESAPVEARRQVLQRAHDLHNAGEARGQPFPGVRYYLLHSFAHMLMSAVSMDCGYPASSIQERIYCSPPGASHGMAGVLLYTGTSGSEGTLGGLVEQGRELRRHLRHALELGHLCSNDPVCASHQPDGPSERRLEGAACHGCLYVAECSCERFNRQLDRSLVVPTLGSPQGLAFFEEGL